MNRIVVPERGAADVDADTWSRLAATEGFQLLLEKGVITATYRGDGGVRLKGACYVGHALCGDYRVEVHEKIPGALLALVRFARRGSFHVTAADAQATEIGPLLRELIRQFLLLLAMYVSGGRQFSYIRERRAGSLAGGRLDVVRTAGLRARGLSHLLAFEVPKVSFKTPTNFVIAAALREIERLSDLIDLEADSVAKARGFSLLFSDCRDYRLLVSRRQELADVAASLAVDARSDNVSDILGIARVILANQSIEPERFLEDRAPRTWFINLELLFEQAVRATMAKLLRDTELEVLNGREHSVPIFGAEQRFYRANPDIVLRGRASRTKIGDVKYKDLDGLSDAGDLYQLIVHAEAFASDFCFLIYPGDGYSLKDLGLTKDGRRVVVATVKVVELQESIRRLLEEMAIANAEAIAA